MRPSLSTHQLPGLPALILFMCIRHTDYVNNDDKVRSLLTNTVNCIKRTVKVVDGTYHCNVTAVFWFSVVLFNHYM